MAVNHKQHSVKQCGVNSAPASPFLETENVDLVKGEALAIFKAVPHSSLLFLLEERKRRNALDFSFIIRVFLSSSGHHPDDERKV